MTRWKDSDWPDKIDGVTLFETEAELTPEQAEAIRRLANRGEAEWPALRAMLDDIEQEQEQRKQRNRRLGCVAAVLIGAGMWLLGITFAIWYLGS